MALFHSFFFFFYSWVIFHCIYVPHLLYLFTCHLSCFHVLVIVNIAAVNIRVKVQLCHKAIARAGEGRHQFLFYLDLTLFSPKWGLPEKSHRGFFLKEECDQTIQLQEIEILDVSPNTKEEEERQWGGGRGVWTLPPVKLALNRLPPFGCHVSLGQSLKVCFLISEIGMWPREDACELCHIWWEVIQWELFLEAKDTASCTRPWAIAFSSL